MRNKVSYFNETKSAWTGGTPRSFVSSMIAIKACGIKFHKNISARHVIHVQIRQERIFNHRFNYISPLTHVSVVLLFLLLMGIVNEIYNGKAKQSWFGLKWNHFRKYTPLNFLCFFPIGLLYLKLIIDNRWFIRPFLQRTPIFHQFPLSDCGRKNRFKLCNYP